MILKLIVSLLFVFSNFEIDYLITCDEFTVGRLRHFTSVTSPLTLLASKQDLISAQTLLSEYQAGIGKGRAAWGKEEGMGIWKAKQRKLLPTIDGTPEKY